MMKTVRSYIRNRPRQSTFYGFIGILALLLILFIVNEKNWRPLKGKTIYFALTDQSLALLEKEGTPADMLAKLEVLKGQTYLTAEKFIRALEATIGQEETRRNKWKILSYAWKTTWIATSNYSPTATAFAVDGNLKTSWSSYAPMTFGMFFQVDIGTPAVINGVVLQVGKDKQGQPVKWEVKTSADGEHWQTIIPRKHFTSGSMLVIPFTPVQARYIQIIQTSISATLSPWLIYELDLLQPVVPWQFERSAVIFWILGCIFLIAPVLLIGSGRVSSGENVMLLGIMTIVILVGWFLRVYDLRAYELSEREFQYLSAVNAGKTDHITRLKDYFQHPETGISWGVLLFVRWAYKLCADYSVAIRIVPAIFGVCTILLIIWWWRIFSQGEPYSFYHGRGDVWEGMITSVLMSVSGFPVWLSRKGDVSVCLLFLIILYLLVTYRFLYRQSTYGWVPILIVLIFAGFLVDSAMKYVPIGILLFGGAELLMLVFARGSHGSWSILKNQAFRLLMYLISVLPLYLCRNLFLQKGETITLSSSFMSFKELFLPKLFQAFQFCGVTGIGLWIASGIALVGMARMIIHRNHGEWFLVFQSIIGGVLGAYCSSSEETFPYLLFIFLGSFWFAKGINTILLLFSSPLKRQESGEILASALVSRQSWLIRTIVLISIVLYVALFSFNSLFFGHSAYPYASECYQEYRRERNIMTLVDAIKTDPNECKLVATLDQRFAKFYPVLYHIDPYFLEFSELKRFSEQGSFPTYIFVSTSLEQNERAPIINFLDRYYTEVGKSSIVALYTLRDTFHSQRQRYIWRDLFVGTGHHIEDAQSSTGVIRVGTKDDPPGLLTFGPFCQVCATGRYIARFALHSDGKSAEVVAILEVVANTYDSLARLELKGIDFVDSTTYQTFDVPFDLDMMDNPAFQMKRLQFLVHFTGRSEVRVDYIELDPPSPRRGRGGFNTEFIP